MFDADFITNPYPTYNYLRTTGPIHWAGDFLGGAWLLPRYKDVANALHDLRLSAKRNHIFTAQFSQEAQAEFAKFNHIFAQWMLFLDPPQHSRLRKLMNKGFTPLLLQQMHPRISCDRAIKWKPRKDY